MESKRGPPESRGSKNFKKLKNAEHFHLAVFSLDYVHLFRVNCRQVHIIWFEANSQIYMANIRFIIFADTLKTLGSNLISLGLG